MSHNVLAVTITSGPVLTPSANSAAPLSATITLTTDEPAIITLHVAGGGDSWSVTPCQQATTDHSVVLLGVKPGVSYDVIVDAEVPGGDSVSASPVQFAPAELPVVFPQLANFKSVPNQMEPGVTMFTAASGAIGTVLYIVDAQGDVIWYYLAAGNLSDVRRLSNGNLLILQDQSMAEIDMLGNTVNRWWPVGQSSVAVDMPEGAIAVDTDVFHHDVLELPGGYEGDFMFLSTELRTFANYPVDEVDTSITTPQASVVGDVVVEMRTDGTIVREWKLLDIIDPYRVSYDSLTLDFYDGLYGEFTNDWSHGNAVVIDPADGNLILSLRHQEALIKISYETGELMWILGDPARWAQPYSRFLLKPENVRGVNFEWPYHQHAPDFTAQGDILLFDNGNGRAVPPTPELAIEDRYSRAVIYSVNELDGRVEQVWSYGGPGALPHNGWYSGALGDADVMPRTGNVLITDGIKMQPSPGEYPRVFELTRDNPPRIVFEQAVTTPGFRIYRAERLEGIYPGCPE